MTNTKFRRRALVSSVAMLLVALVALGSATFAWFAEKPDAYAQGLSIKTTASDGLEIATETNPTFGSSAYLNYDSTTHVSKTAAFNLTPATQAQNVKTEGVVTGKNGNKFFTTKATGAGAFGSGTNTFADASTGNSGTKDVYSEMIYFKLSSTSAEGSTRSVKLTGITMTAPDANDSSNLFKALRVALVASDNEIIGTYYATGAGMNGAVTADAKNKAIGDTGCAATFEPAAVQAAASGLDRTVVTGVTPTNDTSTNAKFITAYIWLDGQDDACFTSNVSALDVTSFLQSVKLDFTLVPA